MVNWAVAFDAVATGSTGADTYRAIIAKRVVTWNDRQVTCGGATFTGAGGAGSPRVRSRWLG